MNANLNLSLKPEDLAKLVPGLRAALPYVVGLVLIGVFGYAAYEINLALQVGPSTGPSTLAPLPKVSFDQKTITSLKSLNPVGSSVPLTGLGTNNPLK